MPRKPNGRFITCLRCGAERYLNACRLKPQGNFCSFECFVQSKGGSTDATKNFWGKVEKRGDDECWGWTAQKRWDGYGRFVNARKPIWAHRFSYELHHGPIASGMVVMHTCDNPECTNPKHLKAVTREENMADMARKGRARNGAMGPRKAA